MGSISRSHGVLNKSLRRISATCRRRCRSAGRSPPFLHSTFIVYSHCWTSAEGMAEGIQITIPGQHSMKWSCAIGLIFETRLRRWGSSFNTNTVWSACIWRRRGIWSLSRLTHTPRPWGTKFLSPHARGFQRISRLCRLGDNQVPQQTGYPLWPFLPVINSNPRHGLH